MTSKDHEELVENYLSHIQKYMKDTGGLFPHIVIFAEHKNPEENQPANSIIHIPIPSEYMDSENGKDVLVDEIFPTIFKKVNETFTPSGIGWASEAWMRTAGADFDIDKEDYKTLPIQKEVLFVCIETANDSKTRIYEIKRDGHQINSDGELVDGIDLIEMTEMKNVDRTEGRFSGLYKKLNVC